MSNRYNLQTYILINTFNAESIHSIDISMNDNIFYKKKLDKNKEYNIKITDYIDFRGPGGKVIKIKWDGEQECADKFMKIHKVIVNEQHLAPHNARIYPKPNLYLDALQSTPEGRDLFKKKIFYPGHQHGWYGEYEFRFLVDPRNMHERTQELYKSACGINNERIFSDMADARFYRRANRL